MTAQVSPGSGQSELASPGAASPVGVTVEAPQPDVAGGEWFWHVVLTLRREGRRDLQVRSDVRGWTEAEATERSRELAQDLVGGVRLARDPADVARIAELEAELAQAQQLVASRGVQRQLLLAEAREREDRDQMRALVRRAIAAGAASSPDHRVAGPGLACQVSLRSGLAPEGLLSETPEGLLALRRLSEGRATARCHVFSYADLVSVTVSVPLPGVP